MSDVKAKTPQEKPQTALDQAMARIEAFIADMEKQQQKAEELATVPDDVARFMTRYTP